ncbi:hypothetical protein KI387_011287, partial [Taxus chinensis]
WRLEHLVREVALFDWRSELLAGPSEEEAVGDWLRTQKRTFGAMAQPGGAGGAGPAGPPPPIPPRRRVIIP